MPTIAELGLDANGISEARVVAYDYKNFPEIIAGAVLQNSPAPSVEIVAPTGAAALTLGAPSISGTQVLFNINPIAGGTAGTAYFTVCRAYISPSQWLYCYGDFVLIGPS